MADLNFDDLESADEPLAEAMPDEADAPVESDLESDLEADVELAAKAEPDEKGGKKKKEPGETTLMSPYTMMLLLTMLALAIGTIFLWLELRQYPTLTPKSLSASPVGTVELPLEAGSFLA